MTVKTSSRRRPLLGLRREPGRLALMLMRLPLKAYRRGLGHMLGRVFIEFDHVGRKSGNTYRTVAMVLHYDQPTGEAVICAGWDTDWYRNVRAHPATRVTLARDTFQPQQRFLTEEEAFCVGRTFRRDHPYRLRLISTVLGWGDLRQDVHLRRFVAEHPFVAFRPAHPSAG